MAGITSGSRKFGRNKLYCQTYRLQDIRAKNKIKRLVEYIEANPNDEIAPKWLHYYRRFVKVGDLTEKPNVKRCGGPQPHWKIKPRSI